MSSHRQIGIPAILSLFILFSSFQDKNKGKVFEAIPSKKSGISFNNKLNEDQKNNILKYEYFYNGGGVAVGDINNDGLDDIFFTGNMSENKLYLNLGDFKFKDISASAGIKGKITWTTGVTMVDINGDGLLDIYVCYSGNGNLESKRNELYINQGDLTFKEEAKAYGLDDPSNSTQAVFFDFDNDGDLDMFLLNHSINVINEIEFDEVRRNRHPFAGDKLFRNDNGKFVDISEAAGIKGHALGFGLGVVASDINGDGWVDLYVSNDYQESDYLYLNNGDGTFTDRLTEQMQHISYFSMGLDVADINNNGLMDIFTLDMLPEDNKRQKLLYGPENYEQYALMVMQGFYHQNMRNMLQLNQGNGYFSEIGQLAGISNTDWSWAALFFDATNSGNKDLFVTNGYYRDYTNRDFLKYRGDYYFKTAVAHEKADTLHLVTSMTSTPLPNYIFENDGKLRFVDKSQEWGINQPNFSSGAAYADLNNDGQLDLVVSNLNSTAFIYQNKYKGLSGNPSNYVQLLLKGKGLNTAGIGAKILAYSGNKTQLYEQMPTRGFQSSVSNRIHIGLGDENQMDSLLVIWPQGGRQVLHNVIANQLIEIEEESGLPVPEILPIQKTILEKSTATFPFQHQEYGFNDFKRQPLLLEMPSYVGPAMATADLNGDGFPDVFVGGSKGFPGKILELKEGQWVEQKGFTSEQEFTDADAVFFDANGNGFPDLYICSGGYHDYLSNDESLQDRLYLNDGAGNLTYSPSHLPKMNTSTATVVVLDINKDGFPDLFVGGRILPGKYPLSPKSYILINNGKGEFKDETSKYLPDDGVLGMVTAAVAMDIDKDGYEDLILVGEYMPIEVYMNIGGQSFSRETQTWIGEDLKGWWTDIKVGDFNNDGNLDLIVGNFGLNTQFKPSSTEPLTLYYGDFDDNSSIDPLLVSYIQNKPYPFPSRDELLDQMYSLRSKFTDYGSYASATIDKVLSKEQMKKAAVLEVNELRSMYLENTGSGFVPKPLPIEAQISPIHAIHPLDYDGDGNLDFILGGNQTYMRLRLGLVDASLGQLFKGNGKGDFELIPQIKSGLYILGDIKSIVELPINGRSLIFGINNNPVEMYQLNEINDEK